MLFAVRVLEHQHRSPREVLESPLQKTLKTQLCTVPSNLSDSVIHFLPLQSKLYPLVFSFHTSAYYKLKSSYGLKGSENNVYRVKHHTTVPDSSENLQEKKGRLEENNTGKLQHQLLVLHRACIFHKRSSQECVTQTSSKKFFTIFSQELPN